MKKLLPLLAVLLVLVPAMLNAQQMIENFDQAPADTNYWNWFNPVNPNVNFGAHYQTNVSADSQYGWIKVSYVNDPVIEGTGAMQVDYSVDNTESWGGYTKLEHWNPDSNAVYDWSAYDSISFWYYNKVPQSLAGRVTFRFDLHDVSNSPNGNKTYDVNNCEYYYSFLNILDDAPGWHKITMPLKADPNFWNGEGFNRTGWAGIAGNNQLDLDKIKGWSFEFSISGAGEGDYSQGTIVLDAMELKGLKKVSLVFFNGRAVPSNVTVDPGWGGGSYEITDKEASVPTTNSIKWNTPPNDWAVWDGLVFILNSPKNLSASWDSDSLHFMIKADAGLDSLKLVLSDDDMDGDGPDLEYEAFYMLKESEVGYDGTWKEVNIALKDFNRNGGAWNGSAMQYDKMMDSTRVKKFKILIASTAAVGKVVYLDNIWTGHPVIDVIAPEAPTGVAGTPGDYYNLVIWQDVPGETGEVYDVYASKKPITDINSPDVDVVATGVNEDVQTAVHWLNYPLQDHDVTFYYAVRCRDAAGNIGPIAVSAAPTTNKAKGIATIALNPPANFAADGDFTEWQNSGIKPFVLSPSTAHIGAGSFTGDNDLTATVYMAADATYLYFAVDAIDDVFSFDPAGNWWEDDAVELFIGLYDWRGPKHNSYERGNEPDYQLLIRVDGLYNGRNGNAMIYSPDSTNYYFEGLGVSDYAIETKIPWTSIAFGDDKVFEPKRGMRIPLDIYIHDSDETNVMNGTLSTSPYDNDNSWQSPEHWSYTWIGDTTNVATAVGGEKNGLVVNTYALNQNYPNPFNPTTTIEYSLAKSGLVTLNVYNTLGQKVKSLVNQRQAAGKHFAHLDAHDLSSGIYFYKIQSGKFTQIKKMILMK